ncbi:MAG: hypothetical protein IPM99_11085 [Rubrivivax sp.]|nr:hypothetical protein [Rubrivivax sp.]
MEAAARRTLTQVEVGERVWGTLLAAAGATLVQGAALLAADYGFRAAVASGDRSTLRSALENHAARIGAADAAWIGHRPAAGRQRPGPAIPPAASAAGAGARADGGRAAVRLPGEPCCSLSPCR